MSDTTVVVGYRPSGSTDIREIRLTIPNKQTSRVEHLARGLVPQSGVVAYVREE